MITSTIWIYILVYNRNFSINICFSIFQLFFKYIFHYVNNLLKVTDMKY